MFVHAASQSLLLDVDPAVIASAVPSTPVAGQGFRVAAKHTEAATLKLREMGYPAPSPIVSYYKWPLYKGKFQPFGHQKVMAEFMTMHYRCFNLGEMGSGKTNSVLWALDYMMQTKRIRKTVITGPLSTLDSVWMQGVFDTIMHRKAVIVHGSREKRLALLAGDFDIFIINHEGLNIKPIREAIRTMPGLDLIVVDEGSKFRNAKTDRYKSLETILAREKLRLWWLTGTPTPNGPDDAWAQCRLVNPRAVPRFYGQFRDRVMVEMSEHVWKPRAGYEDVVHKAMQPAIRIAKADCLDLPPMTFVDWNVEMTPDQLAAHKQMSEAMQIADTRSKEAGVVVTAQNAADRVNKLRQIMLGSIKVGPTDYQTYDYSPRYNLLLEAIRSAQAKAVVVVPFKGILLDLAKRLSKDETCAYVNGDVSIGRRNKIFAEFKYEKDPRVLLCHPEVMSHGLNLTEADYLIFYGPMYGNDPYRQVIERINRPPQTKKMTVVRIGCNAMERAIYSSLEADESQQQVVLRLYKSVIQGAR